MLISQKRAFLNEAGCACLNMNVTSVLLYGAIHLHSYRVIEKLKHFKSNNIWKI